MAEPNSSRVIRYPLDGDDLALLLDLPRSGSPRTQQRRTARLAGLGLLDPSSKTPARHPLLHAAAAAVRERSDLPERLETPSHLAVLAALPDRSPWLPAHRLAGVSRHTYRSCITQMARAGLVVIPERRARLSPRLPALGNFVQTYRTLYDAPPPGNDPAEWLPYHQHGVETFWVIRREELPTGITPVGPSADTAAYGALAMPWHLGYFGPRTLDPWDHLLATLICERPRGARAHRPDVRLLAAFAAATTTPELENTGFRVRARYYGAEAFVDDIHHAVTRHDGPIWSEAQRLRREFGPRGPHGG